jgi:hypothetical protein
MLNGQNSHRVILRRLMVKDQKRTASSGCASREVRASSRDVERVPVQARLNHDVLSADDLERHWGRVDAAADIETPELVEGWTACSGLEQVMVLFHPAQAPTRAGPPKGRNVLSLLPPQDAPRLSARR